MRYLTIREGTPPAVRSLARRKAKWLWLKQNSTLNTYRGRLSDIPKYGCKPAQHYYDIKQLREQGNLEISPPPPSLSGQLLTITLHSEPPLLYRPNRNTQETLPEPKTCLQEDKGIEARKKRTMAIYLWLKEHSENNIWRGRTTEIPQGDMASGGLRQHLQKLRKLGVLKVIERGNGFRPSIYKLLK